MKPQSGWIEAFFVVDGALFSAPRLGGAAAPDVMTKGHPAPALSGYFLCISALGACPVFRPESGGRTLRGIFFDIVRC